MGRTRDVSKILTSNTSILTLASASTTYATKASTGLTLLTPGSITNTGGTASIGANGTVTFSGVASQSFNNVFSATYDYYRIVGAANGSTTANLVFRLRAAGTDLSSANYAYVQYGAGSSTNSSLTSAVFAFLNSTNIAGFEATLLSPFLTVPKPYVAQSGDKIGTDNFLGYSTGGGIDSSVSYDGFTIFPSSGTVTGKVSVYGYNL